MSDIFLSYSRKDSDYALQFAVDLRSHGAKIWMDTASLTAAETWSAEIVNAIRECQIFIVLLSPHAVISHNVTKELLLASELQKTIVPIDLEECVLSDAMIYALAGLHRISARDEISLKRWFEKFGIASDSDKLITPVQLPNSHDIHKLAVLPFDDLSPSKDNDWFADGMTDELIGTLGSLDKLHVNPRNDVMYYKGKQPKLSEIANDLGVRYVVTGSVQKIAEKIRIRASLSDALTHQQIWADKYDGTFDDIFALQDRTAKEIVAALRLKLTPAEEHHIDLHPTEKPLAYELYLKGREYIERGSRSDYNQALLLFEQAIEIDPLYVDPLAAIANVCHAYYRSYSRERHWLDRAESALEKAESITGKTPDILSMMSLIKLQRRKTDEALHDAEEAIRLDPQCSVAYASLGYCYKTLGRIDELIAVRRKYVELRPYDLQARFSLLASLNEQGDKTLLKEAAENAVPVYEKYFHNFPDNFNAKVEFVTVLFMAGRNSEALTIAKDLAQNDMLAGVHLYNLCCFFCNINDIEEGLRLFRKAIEKGYSDIETINRDPDLNSLRNIEEFKILCQKLTSATV